MFLLWFQTAKFLSKLSQAKSKEAKKEAKLIKQLQEEELRVLFNEGIAGQFGKKKSKAQNSASQLGIAEANKAVSEFLEALSSESSDSDEDDNLKHQQGWLRSLLLVRNTKYCDE